MKAAIFDLDGTLLDSMPIWDTVDFDYLKMHGKAPHENLQEKFKTMSMQQAAAYFQSEYGIEDSLEKIMQDILALIANFYQYEVPLKAGVKELLAYLKQQKIKMSVATVNHKSMVEAALKRTGVLEYFDHILTCEELQCDKNTPLIYQKSCELLQAVPSQTYVFEDSLHAAITAKKAEFIVVGVYDMAAKAEQEDLKQVADFYIESFEDWKDKLC